MTPVEVGNLLDFIQEMNPKLEFGEPDIKRWSRLLRDVRATPEQVEEAVVAVLLRQWSIEPHEFSAEVTRIREDIAERHPITNIPFSEDDKYRPELLAMNQRIADGGRGMARWTGALEPPITSKERSEASPHSVAARAQAHGQDAEFVRKRDASMKVGCSWCKASPGEVCVVEPGRPLTQGPAHRPRLEAVGLLQPAELTPQEAAEALRAIVEAEEGGPG